MKKNKDSKAMTFEQVLKDPALAHLHEAILFIKDKKPEDIFPKQYEKAMLSVTGSRLFDIFEKNPQTSLKQALLGVIKDLPKGISDTLLVKVVNHVIEIYPEFLASAPKEKQIVTPTRAPNHAPKQALELA